MPLDVDDLFSEFGQKSQQFSGSENPWQLRQNRKSVILGVNMAIEIVLAKLSDKPVLRKLLELYQHDMSEFNGKDVNQHGEFGYNYLDHYWTELGRFPFLVKISGALAGFALIREVSSGEEKYFSMAEFFIVRKYRNRGLGNEVAHKLFERFPGQWKIAQEEQNLPVGEFWHKVISGYTGDRFEFINEDDWDGPVIRFVTTSEK